MSPTQIGHAVGWWFSHGGSCGSVRSRWLRENSSGCSGTTKLVLFVPAHTSNRAQIVTVAAVNAIVATDATVLFIDTQNAFSAARVAKVFALRKASWHDVREYVAAAASAAPHSVSTPQERHERDVLQRCACVKAFSVFAVLKAITDLEATLEAQVRSTTTFARPRVFSDGPNRVCRLTRMPQISGWWWWTVSPPWLLLSWAASQRNTPKATLS